MPRSTESPPMPSSSSRSHPAAKATISSAWAGPDGLSKSRMRRQVMSRSALASRTPAARPSQIVSIGTPSFSANPGEKNISRYRTPAATPSSQAS